MDGKLVPKKFLMIIKNTISRLFTCLTFAKIFENQVDAKEQEIRFDPFVKIGLLKYEKLNEKFYSKAKVTQKMSYIVVATYEDRFG